MLEILKSRNNSKEKSSSDNIVQQAACGVSVSGFSNSYVQTCATSFVTTRMIELAFRSNRDVSFVPEEPPDNLLIELRYTRGGVMTKHDVWAAITRTMAKTALSIWNAELVGSAIFPVVSDVEIRFISSVNLPRYQSKTIIWSLAEAFDFYNEQRLYSDCIITTKFRTRMGLYYLGVGSIKSALSNRSGLQKNSSGVRSADHQSLDLTPNDSAINVST